MTIEETMQLIDDELFSISKAPPIKRVMLGEADGNRFEVPAVLIERVGRVRKTDMQVLQHNKTAWEAEYLMSVFSSSASDYQSVRNSQKIVDRISHRIERENHPRRLLDHNAIGVYVHEVKYGTLAISAATAKTAITIAPVDYIGGTIRIAVLFVDPDTTD